MANEVEKYCSFVWLYWAKPFFFLEGQNELLKSKRISRWILLGHELETINLKQGKRVQKYFMTKSNTLQVQSFALGCLGKVRTCDAVYKDTFEN